MTSPSRSRSNGLGVSLGVSLRVLVATNVAARGLDVSDLELVINYDLPENGPLFTHRVGRTGRMGREGVAFTFVCPHEGPELTRIEERIGRLLKREELKDFEATSWKYGTPVGYSRSKDMAASAPTDGEAFAVPAPPPPPSTLMKRPPKKYRRAL